MKRSGSKHLVSALCLHYDQNDKSVQISTTTLPVDYHPILLHSHLIHALFGQVSVQQVQTSEKVHTHKCIKHVVYITSINTNIITYHLALLQHLSSQTCHPTPPKKSNHSYLFPNRCPNPPRGVGNSFHQMPAAPPLRSVASGDENFKHITGRGDQHPGTR